MGLSAMMDTPDMDQALRFANAAGAMSYITPHQWVGEQNLNGLGLADSQTDIASGVNAATGAFQQIYGTIQAAKLAKAAAKNAAKGQQHPAAQMMPASMTAHQGDGGGSDLGKWLLIGGVAIAGIVVLMMVMKKKKKNDGE